ncbi:TPT-domain-containing protein [Hymenopellis radicata]|nr:TPT-domain-containing protein [Hymenopellis radicata]
MSSIATNDVPSDVKAITYSLRSFPASRRPSQRSLRPSPPRVYHRDPFLPSPVDIEPSKDDSLCPPVTSPKDKPSFSSSKTFWVSLYFCFNLGLTLYNKGVLVSFPFPYTLTAIHALFGTLGGAILLGNGSFHAVTLSGPETLLIVAFSILYSVNIVVSNISLHLVTIPFHQVIRAATPIFTIMFSSIMFGQHSSYMKRVSLIPVVLGVGFATYGDYYYTAWGFMLTLLGTVLASLKTIFTHVLQSPRTASSPTWRPQLPSLALLYLLSPLAFIECVLLAFFTGELHDVRQYATHDMTTRKGIALAANGCIALGLNIVSFTANRQVGALGMTVAANVKQVLTIVLAVLIFDLSISFTNAIGILLTLAGGVWYAYVEFVERKKTAT